MMLFHTIARITALAVAITSQLVFVAAGNLRSLENRNNDERDYDVRREVKRFDPKTVEVKDCTVVNDKSGNYDTWVAKTKALMDCNGKTEVFMGMSSQEYLWRFSEFVDITVSKGFPNAQLVMIAFDEPTYNWFDANAKNVPVLYLGADRKDEIYKHVKESKSRAPLMFLYQGYTVIFSEMDIFWRSPPTFPPDVEFLVSEHSYAGEINIGFYMVRPTPNTLGLFHRLMHYMDNPVIDEAAFKDPLCGHDQKLMDFAVRGAADDTFIVKDILGQNRNKPANQCGLQNRTKFEEFKARLAPPVPIHWEFLPYDVLPHYPVDGMHTITEKQLRNPKMAGIHMFGLIRVKGKAEWIRENWLNGPGKLD